MSFLDTISTLSVKKCDVTLPIAKLSGTITPLLVGDDLALKSSTVSPVNYERDIVKLLHKHTELVVDGETLQLSYNEFTEKISNIDKVALLWGLYKATYNDLGKQKVICENCEYENIVTITADMLIQPDTFTVWEEDLPFYEYTYPIVCPYNDVVYVFHTKLPTIRNHITLLSIVPSKELKQNIESLGMIFTRPLQLTLITKGIDIYRAPQGKAPHTIKLEDLTKHNDSDDSLLLASTKVIQEILIAFENHIPYEISDNLLKQYGDKFDKYMPNFYTEFECIECGKPIKYSIDIELLFLRRTLFGPEFATEGL